MKFIDLYPACGTFQPGEEVQLIAELAGEAEEAGAIRLSIFHLNRQVRTLEHPISITTARCATTIGWTPDVPTAQGYGVEAELLDSNRGVLDRASTAVDVLERWTDFPRYGFLSDFAPDRDDVEATIDSLRRYHINGLQFYDWHYRHDSPLPPAETYHDPLGRVLSRGTLKRFLDTARNCGMACMAYLAVYAASLEFWQQHPAMALYDSSGTPLSFEGFLGLMDPSPGSDWTRHLLQQSGEVLDRLGFDGLHIDQYGEPKLAFNHRGQSVDLPEAFTEFIAALRRDRPQAAVVFNAVGNWPIEQLATADQHFVYIEINHEIPTYEAVREVLLDARRLSGGKPVVLAWYLPSQPPPNLLIADALALSLGGSRIELGERDRLLTDPYFPKHQPLPLDLSRTLRRYYDFAVRYGDLIGPSAKLDPRGLSAQGPPGTWAIARSSRGWLTICLVNHGDSAADRWDLPLPAPRTIRDVVLEVDWKGDLANVLWASPDRGDLSLMPVEWAVESGILRATFPELRYWSILALQLDH